MRKILEKLCCVRRAGAVDAAADIDVYLMS